MGLQEDLEVYKREEKRHREQAKSYAELSKAARAKIKTEEEAAAADAADLEPDPD